MNRLEQVMEASATGFHLTPELYARMQKVRQDLTGISSEVSSIAGRARYLKDAEGMEAAKKVEQELDDIRHFIFLFKEA